MGVTFPRVPVPRLLELPWPSFHWNCSMIIRSKHIPLLKLSSSQADIFNINQFKLTEKFDSCISDSATSTHLHLAPLQKGHPLERQQCPIFSHCHESIRVVSTGPRSACAAVAWFVQVKVAHVHPTASSSGVGYRIRQTGDDPGWSALALRGSVAILLLSLA